MEVRPPEALQHNPSAATPPPSGGAFRQAGTPHRPLRAEQLSEAELIKMAHQRFGAAAASAASSLAAVQQPLQTGTTSRTTSTSGMAANTRTTTPAPASSAPRNSLLFTTGRIAATAGALETHPPLLAASTKPAHLRRHRRHALDRCEARCPFQAQLTSPAAVTSAQAADDLAAAFIGTRIQPLFEPSAGSSGEIDGIAAASFREDEAERHSNAVHDGGLATCALGPTLCPYRHIPPAQVPSLCTPIVHSPRVVTRWLWRENAASLAADPCAWRPFAAEWETVLEAGFHDYRSGALAARQKTAASTTAATTVATATASVHHASLLLYTPSPQPRQEGVSTGKSSNSSSSEWWRQRLNAHGLRTDTHRVESSAVAHRLLTTMAVVDAGEGGGGVTERGNAEKKGAPSTSSSLSALTLHSTIRNPPTPISTRSGGGGSHGDGSAVIGGIGGGGNPPGESLLMPSFSSVYKGFAIDFQRMFVANAATGGDRRPIQRVRFTTNPLWLLVPAYSESVLVNPAPQQERWPVDAAASATLEFMYVSGQRSCFCLEMNGRVCRVDLDTMRVTLVPTMAGSDEVGEEGGNDDATSGRTGGVSCALSPSVAAVSASIAQAAMLLVRQPISCEVVGPVADLYDVPSLTQTPSFMTPEGWVLHGTRTTRIPPTDDNHPNKAVNKNKSHKEVTTRRFAALRKRLDAAKSTTTMPSNRPTSEDDEDEDGEEHDEACRTVVFGCDERGAFQEGLPDRSPLSAIASPAIIDGILQDLLQSQQLQEGERCGYEDQLHVNPSLATSSNPCVAVVAPTLSCGAAATICSAIRLDDCAACKTNPSHLWSARHQCPQVTEGLCFLCSAAADEEASHATALNAFGGAASGDGMGGGGGLTVCADPPATFNCRRRAALHRLAFFHGPADQQQQQTRPQQQQQPQPSSVAATATITAKSDGVNAAPSSVSAAIIIKKADAAVTSTPPPPKSREAAVTWAEIDWRQRQSVAKRAIQFWDTTLSSSRLVPGGSNRTSLGSGGGVGGSSSLSMPPSLSTSTQQPHHQPASSNINIHSNQLMRSVTRGTHVILHNVHVGSKEAEWVLDAIGLQHFLKGASGSGGVVKIQRVQSTVLYNRYMRGRQELFSDIFRLHERDNLGFIEDDGYDDEDDGTAAATTGKAATRQRQKRASGGTPSDLRRRQSQVAPATTTSAATTATPARATLTPHAPNAADGASAGGGSRRLPSSRSSTGTRTPSPLPGTTSSGSGGAFVSPSASAAFASINNNNNQQQHHQQKTRQLLMGRRSSFDARVEATEEAADAMTAALSNAIWTHAAAARGGSGGGGSDNDDERLEGARPSSPPPPQQQHQSPAMPAARRRPTQPTRSSFARPSLRRGSLSVRGAAAGGSTASHANASEYMTRRKSTLMSLAGGGSSSDESDDDGGHQPQDSQPEEEEQQSPQHFVVACDDDRVREGSGEGDSHASPRRGSGSGTAGGGTGGVGSPALWRRGSLLRSPRGRMSFHGAFGSVANNHAALAAAAARNTGRRMTDENTVTSGRIGGVSSTSAPPTAAPAASVDPALTSNERIAFAVVSQAALAEVLEGRRSRMELVTSAAAVLALYGILNAALAGADPSDKAMAWGLEETGVPCTALAMLTAAAGAALQAHQLHGSPAETDDSQENSNKERDARGGGEVVGDGSSFYRMTAASGKGSVVPSSPPASESILMSPRVPSTRRSGAGPASLDEDANHRAAVTASPTGEMPIFCTPQPLRQPRARRDPNGPGVSIVEPPSLPLPTSPSAHGHRDAHHHSDRDEFDSPRSCPSPSSILRDDDGLLDTTLQLELSESTLRPSSALSPATLTPRTLTPATGHPPLPLPSGAATVTASHHHHVPSGTSRTQQAPPAHHLSFSHLSTTASGRTSAVANAANAAAAMDAAVAMHRTIEEHVASRRASAFIEQRSSLVPTASRTLSQSGSTAALTGRNTPAGSSSRNSDPLSHAEELSSATVRNGKKGTKTKKSDKNKATKSPSQGKRSSQSENTSIKKDRRRLSSASSQRKKSLLPDGGGDAQDKKKEHEQEEEDEEEDDFVILLVCVAYDGLSADMTELVLGGGTSNNNTAATDSAPAPVALAGNAAQLLTWESGPLAGFTGPPPFTATSSSSPSSSSSSSATALSSAMMRVPVAYHSTFVRLGNFWESSAPAASTAVNRQRKDVNTDDGEQQEAASHAGQHASSFRPVGPMGSGSGFYSLSGRRTVTDGASSVTSSSHQHRSNDKSDEKSGSKNHPMTPTKPPVPVPQQAVRGGASTKVEENGRGGRDGAIDGAAAKEKEPDPRITTHYSTHTWCPLYMVMIPKSAGMKAKSKGEQKSCLV